MKSREEKRGFLSELIRIMRSDGVEQENERRMLVVSADFLGLTEMDLQELLDDPERYNPPKPERERIVQFYQMAFMVRADQKTDPDEQTYLNWLCVMMGLREEASKAIIERMTDFPNEYLKPSEVIDIFQVFHN